MKLRKLLALSLALTLVLGTTLSVSADGLFFTDFSNKTLDSWMISPNASSVDHYIDFFDGGVRMTGFEQGTNFHTLIIPWDLTGMERGKDYIITFAGKSLVDDPTKSSMIVQVLAKTESVAWTNLVTIDGMKAEDGKGLTVPEDGLFMYHLIVDGEYLADSKFDEGFHGLCIWGTWGHNPTSYDLYFIEIVDKDDFNPDDYELVDLSPPILEHPRRSAMNPSPYREVEGFTSYRFGANQPVEEVEETERAKARAERIAQRALEEAAALEAEAAANANVVEEAVESATAAPVTPTSTNDSSDGMNPLIVVLIFVAIGAIAGIGFFFIKRKK